MCCSAAWRRDSAGSGRSMFSSRRARRRGSFPSASSTKASTPALLKSTCGRHQRGREVVTPQLEGAFCPSDASISLSCNQLSTASRTLRAMPADHSASSLVIDRQSSGYLEWVACGLSRARSSTGTGIAKEAGSSRRGPPDRASRETASVPRPELPSGTSLHTVAHGSRPYRAGNRPSAGECAQHFSDRCPPSPTSGEPKGPRQAVRS